MKTMFMLLISLVTLFGCSSSTPTPAVTDYKLVIHADKNINANSKNVANPVVVRIYQLKEPGLFEQASFIQLFKSDTSTLAGSLISKKVITGLTPGKSETIDLGISSSTNYIAAIAEFSRYQDANAKAEIAVPSSNNTSIYLNISGLNISMKPQQQSSWWQIF